MIIEYIERLRKEPKDVRQQAVYTWTVVILILIALSYVGIRILMATAFDTAPTQNTLAAPYVAR